MCFCFCFLYLGTVQEMWHSLVICWVFVEKLEVLCLMQLRFELLNSVIKQPYCMYTIRLLRPMYLHLHIYMSKHDSRSPSYNITSVFAFKNYTLNTWTQWWLRGARCKKKSFTLNCSPSRTLGAVANQLEELAVGKVKSSLFESIQKELEMNKPTHHGKLSRPLPLLDRIAFNTQPPGMLVINSLQVLK